MWSVPVDLTWTTEGRPIRSGSHTVEISRSFTFVMHTRTPTWAAGSADGRTIGWNTP